MSKIDGFYYCGFIEMGANYSLSRLNGSNHPNQKQINSVSDDYDSYSYEQKQLIISTYKVLNKYYKTFSRNKTVSIVYSHYFYHERNNIYKMHLRFTWNEQIYANYFSKFFINSSIFNGIICEYIKSIYGSYIIFLIQNIKNTYNLCYLGKDIFKMLYNSIINVICEYILHVINIDKTTPNLSFSNTLYTNRLLLLDKFKYDSILEPSFCAILDENNSIYLTNKNKEYGANINLRFIGHL